VVVATMDEAEDIIGALLRIELLHLNTMVMFASSISIKIATIII
jgi:hypothetical protein